MKAFDAMKQGITITGQHKRYIVFVYLANLLIALIFAAVLAQSISESLGSSMAAENLQTGFDGHWYNSYRVEATGLAATFDPAVVEFGAVLKSLNGFLTGNLTGGYFGIFVAGSIFMVMWTFFSAGFISTYAQGDEQASFYQQAGRYFPRFLVLMLISLLLYFLLFRFVFSWLTDVVNSMTRETIDERVDFFLTFMKYLILWALFWFVNMLFDYSKILVVSRDLRNPLTAPLKALGLILQNFGRTSGLYLSIGVVWLCFMMIYWLISIDPQAGSWLPLLIAFVLGQLYIIARIWTRCLFYAGQTAMCLSLT